MREKEKKLMRRVSLCCFTVSIELHINMASNAPDGTNLKLLFDLLDKDCDGKISRDDVAKFSAENKNVLSGSEIEKMFAKETATMDFESFKKSYHGMWDRFGDAGELEDALLAVSDNGQLDFNAGIVQSITADSSTAQEIAKQFTKTNKITGAETFKGTDFLQTVRK